MKGYKTKLQIDLLTALRDEFFTDRIKREGQIWKNIRYACVYDAEKCEKLLSALKLTAVNGCMNHLVDETGLNHYIVPNFCINDPYVEKTFLNVDKARESSKISVSFLFR